MSEELLQRGLDKNNPSERLGKWDYFCIGATTVKTLKQAIRKSYGWSKKQQ